MIPTGYVRALTRALLYQHCRGYDPELLVNHTHSAGTDAFAVWCPVCERLITGPTDREAVSDWNDHVIARLSGGLGSK